MKLITSIALLVFSLSTSGQRSLQEIFNAHKEKYLDKKFPAFSIKAINSESFSNANFKDKVVFINFWFESCLPCIQKIEGLNQLFEKLKNDTNFVFVSFTYENYQTIENFKKRHGIEYNIYHMESNQCDSICCGYPTTFILDRDGTTRFLFIGGTATKEEATSEILTEIYPKILKLR